MRSHLKFSQMGDYPLDEEGVPFLILRHGNDMHSFLIQQVQNFEGGIYPDELSGAIDHTDSISDAVGWSEIPVLLEPLTIDHAEQQI